MVIQVGKRTDKIYNTDMGDAVIVRWRLREKNRCWTVEKMLACNVADAQNIKENSEVAVDIPASDFE